MKRKELIKKAIENYTERTAEIVGIVDDPKVEGTVAIRSILYNKKGKKICTVDWLAVRFLDTMSPEEVECILEEVEFESWPPTSGSLRFF